MKSATKAHRFKPPDTARASSERLVLYELLSMLRESASLKLDTERLLSLQRRIPLVMTDSDVAQALAEEDGEAVDDGV